MIGLTSFGRPRPFPPCHRSFMARYTMRSVVKHHIGIRSQIRIVAEKSVREPLVDVRATVPKYQHRPLLFANSDGGGSAGDTLFLNTQIRLAIQEDSGIGSATQAVGELGHQHSQLLVSDVVQFVAVYLDGGRLAGLVDGFGLAGPL